jgi:hypothetical protein
MSRSTNAEKNQVEQIGRTEKKAKSDIFFILTTVVQQLICVGPPPNVQLRLKYLELALR